MGSGKSIPGVDNEDARQPLTAVSLWRLRDLCWIARGIARGIAPWRLFLFMLHRRGANASVIGLML